MKILLVNKFYYPRGGDCVYTLNLESLLKEKGHEVAVFAMQHPENLDTPYKKYFPSEVAFAPANKKRMLEVFIRPFGSSEVKRKFKALLNDFKPDIVHLNNIHTQLSPILAEIAYKKGIKVVWTLHDYKLLCSRHDCLRNEKPCELCFRKKENVLKYNCVKNSRIGSLLGYLESLKWNKKILEKYTDTFICPSGFMKEKMLSGGFNEEKIKTVCNFTAIKKDITEKFQKEIYYCYVGRLSKEKGVETLLRAAQQHSYLLKIAGNGPLYNDLKEKYASEKIVFLGYLNQKEIKELIEKACFTVIPSEWYENNPLAVIESLSLGTPVLGSDMGGIPELIEPGETGMIFEAKNREDLSEKIKEMFDAKKSFDSERIAKNAMKRFSYDRYYLELMNIYTKA